jgi:hypothetical protein
VLVVAGQVISDTTFARVHQTTPKRLLINLLSSCGFNKRRPSQENMPLFANDDIFIGHCGDICAACDGNTMHDSDLGDAKRRHLGLRNIGDTRN